MKRRRHNRVVFKPYTQAQPQLLATDLNELLPENHVARVVSRVVDNVDLRELEGTYLGGGAGSYSPRMMLKVMVYCYIMRIYTTRKMAKACREDVPTMYLAGRAQPGFRTFGMFRGSRLVGVMETIFAKVLEQLIASGHVAVETVFVDGSKIAADANPAKMMWAKRVKKNRAQVEEKIQELLRRAEQEAAEEDARYGDRDLEEVGEAATPVDELDLEATVQELNDLIRRAVLERPVPEPKPAEPLPVTPLEAELERLKQERPASDSSAPASLEQIETRIDQVQREVTQRPTGKRLKKTLGDLRAKVRRAGELQGHEQTLAGRSGYSRTDPDASPMRLKEDRAARQPMARPAYNTQLSTAGQYIVQYSVHTTADDNSCLLPHLRQLQESVGRLPDTLVADSGYGTEENYTFLEQAGVEACVKYSTFHDDLHPTASRRPLFTRAQFIYRPEHDTFTCPAGQTLTYQRTEDRPTTTGFLTRTRVYTTPACLSCPLKSSCTRGKGGRSLTYNPALEAHRVRARNLLTSPRGKDLRARRGMDVETVFANIKHNHRFRRFHLRGLPKVSTEWGLICLAHNLSKRALA